MKMGRYWGALVLCLGLAPALMVMNLAARPLRNLPTIEEPEGSIDVVGDRDGVGLAPRKALQDTVWIADWSFDVGSACSDAGWEKVDLRIMNDGQLYWNVDPGFDGMGGIAGNAAALGYTGSTCCAHADGYDNNWYQAIRIEYSGSGTLSFDYLLDSEDNYDFLRVELDSACASLDLVDYTNDPIGDASRYRRVEFEQSGVATQGHLASIPVTDFGTSETHCLYISFFSDAGWSPCDGLWGIDLGRALVVDHIELAGVNVPVMEDFEGPLDPALSFANIQYNQPFGQWARVFRHITDNDFCTENTTCAWLFSDDTTPTLFNDPAMSFAPGGYVIRNWLDNAIVSPWVSLASTFDAKGTFVTHRTFGGNNYGVSRIVMGVNLRGKGGEEEVPGCDIHWGREGSLWSLNDFHWRTWSWDFTPYFDPTSTAVQVRFRVSDLQYQWGWDPPTTWVPAPGPFIDDVRIGRLVLTGPVMLLPGPGIGTSIRNSKLAQDAFPTEIDPTIPSGSGEHFRPSTDRFGTAAFSMAHDHAWLTGWETPQVVTGDSILIRVEDVRGASGITSVEWHGAIVSGPHAGKAPPPWTVDANGFFVVPADSARAWWAGNSVVEGLWFADLDDDYFRGGDRLLYFWLARDALGGVTSFPGGLTEVPASVEEAEALTGGLWEVSFLPTIDWDSSYLGRIAADPHGKLEPTSTELASSSQANCILYVNAVNLGRKSGDLNRTSFMYTLDKLGYREHYDVYDHMGLGSARNELGGRATLAQASGYSLIIHDGGLHAGGIPWSEGDKVDQSTWYRNWLAGAVGSDAGTATLWVIGANMAEVHEFDPLFFGEMGVALASGDVGIDLNPDIDGQASFTFEDGRTAGFSSDGFTLNGGCPAIHHFDGVEASGSALVTHRFTKGQRVFEGGAVMNRNTTEHWNTILMSFPWFDIVDPEGTPGSPPPENQLMEEILSGVLPLDCLQSPTPTDTEEEPELEDVPQRTALYQNVPNPFNPTTVIRFDLARKAHVTVRIYDVAGRLVRTLVNEFVEAGFHREAWNGLDDGGQRVASGVYLYRLEAGDFRDTRKLVVMK